MDGVSSPLTSSLRRRLGLSVVRLRRDRTETAQVGLQFAGDRLLLARVVRLDGEVQVDALRAVAAPAAQRAAAMRALKQEGLLRNARIHVLLAPGQYDVHQVARPAVPAEELRDALRWQLRGSLGYPPEEALLDVTTLPQPADAPSSRVLVTTARRSVVADVIAPLAACNVPVDAVDVPEFAQRNLAHGGSADPGKSDAWLAFDQDTFLLTVHCMGELAFARRMLLPNAALSAETDADPVAHFVERVVLQVQRSLDLFERQSGLPAVTQILIGPHPHAAAIADELRQRSFARPVLAESTDLLRRAAAASSGAFAAELTGVIGAALRTLAGRDGVAAIQSIDLNLQGPTHRAEVPFRLPLAVALAAIVAGLGAVTWTEGRSVELQRATAAQLAADVKRAEQALAALKPQAAARADAPASAEADVAALEALASRLGEIASARNEPFTESLRALARARAEGVWLTGIRLGHARGPMVLEGRALDASRVPLWLAALQSEPRFAGTAFARIDLQPAREPAGAVQFRIGTDAGAPDSGAGR